ncbi:MAG TPA: hypothetical protein VGG40_05150 [Solirubrobacterales bacterium]|jgi:predicted RNA-binding Zn-ribbon protein involved in translation (DUF1610 family)
MPGASPDQSQSLEVLHQCPRCGSGMVQPLAWEPAGDRTSWRVWRRCPECGWRGDAVHAEAAIEAYDEQLDRGAHALLAELRELQRENMAAMAEAFVVALDADLIGADDFARRPA